MRNILLASASILIAGAVSASADAANPADKISTNGAFEENDYGVENSNNTDVRFGTGGAISIPGDTKANDSSAIEDRTGKTDLVRPPSRN